MLYVGIRVNRSSFLNIATWVVPIACLALAAGVIYYEVRRIRLLDEERVRVDQNIAFVEKLRQEITRQAPAMMNRFPTVEQSPKEQPDFLNKLRIYAAAARVRIVRWSNATPIAPTSDRDSGLEGRSSIPPGVIPIASSIEVAGVYNNIRGFLYSLLSDPRLFSMNDIQWVRGDQWPRTRVSFTLTRYVTREKSPLNDLSAGAGALNSPLDSRPLNATSPQRLTTP